MKILTVPNVSENLKKEVKRSFDPISNKQITILILGSLPGDKSLEMGEYYGHARNRFWNVIASITKTPLPRTYDSKKLMLLNNKIGVWDVASSAQRTGSLDTAIKNELPNDLNGFISKHKKLRAIAFNGSKAEALFNKYFERNDSIVYFSLPSTSPANAGCNLEKMILSWTQICLYM